MSGSARARVLLPFVVTLVAACGGPRIHAKGPGKTAQPSVPVIAIEPQPEQDQGEGVDLVPIHIRLTIFGSPAPVPTIRPPSSSLASVPASNPRLHVTPLPSGEGTTAVDLKEDSPKGHTWGELMTPAQRAIFRTFAADPSLGRYLVIVDDVNVMGSPDPIPVTAYRWTRAEVEKYARCGIPSFGIDRCTAAFYLVPDMEIVPGAGAAGSGV